MSVSTALTASATPRRSLISNKSQSRKIQRDFDPRTRIEGDNSTTLILSNASNGLCPEASLAARDSAAGNAYVIYYSNFGTLTQMEAAYARLKMSRILIEKEAIRSISLAYIRNHKLYSLGEFARDVGLSRRNIGNLLWNLWLLSYAANFKMKSLQREFVRMVESGFSPDLTTFNIRALAFSKMSLFWDLHLTLEHMNHDKVVPDLVTYGSIVDAYLDASLGRNLDFALGKLNVHESVPVATEPLVFEAMGKGDFHLSSEARLEFSKKRNWSYKELIRTYLKKHFHRNQIFWNY